MDMFDESKEPSIIVVFKFDANGNYLYPVEHTEGAPLQDDTTTVNPFINRIYKPKWDRNSEQWVEGESEEEKTEREAQQLLESLKPSPNEIANAELEIKILTMLTDLGVVQ